MNKSFFGKKWLLSSKEPINELRDLCNNNLVAKLLATRDINSTKEAEYYIGNQKPNYSKPSNIPQLDKAIERIEKAITNKENIVIFGDYDVDGTTSTALLTSALKKLEAKVDFVIPNRFTDGYGLNSKAVVRIKAQKKAKLLITCDCGITNVEEVKLAQSIGLDVIVTDHHSLPDTLPPAIAVLNPKLLPEKHPLHWLPGVGVAYKLAEELLTRSNQTEQIEELLDLVALGMIADLAPLRSENRLLVQDGLQVLADTNRMGLQALLRECGYQSCEEGVGFAIAPRINAAGRLHDANDAVKLFLAEDITEAQFLAKQLTSQNESRQELCDEIYKEALNKIDNEINLDNARAIMISDPKWHHGVVGIVASRLAEKLHLPVFIGVEESEKGSIKGSARGIGSIDLFEEMNKFAELFDKFGGHKAAAGFSMNKDNWETFKSKFQSELQKTLMDSDLEPVLEIDAEISPEDITIPNLDPVWNLAPFGMGFTKPTFVSKQALKIKDIVPLGKNQDHTKLLLETQNGTIEAVQWRVAPHKFIEAKSNSETIQIVFTPNKREFRGRNYLQLEIKDWIIEAGTQAKTHTTSNNNSSIQQKPKLIDYRKAHEKLTEILGEKHLFFAEGNSSKHITEFEKETICFHRISELNKECNSLVFWSLPLDGTVIDKVIASCRPEQIMVFGKNLEENLDTKSFLKKLLSFVRNHEQIKVNAEKSISTNLGELASEIESLEKTCIEGLKILEQSGILSFKIEGQTVNIVLTNIPKKVQLDTSSLQKQLLIEQQIKQRLLKESVEKVLCLKK